MAKITAASMRATLRALADDAIAQHSARFFRSGKGEYGEGDRFLGIRVPILRQNVRKFRDAPESSLRAILKSAYHEERLFAVLLLVDQYARGDQEAKDRIYRLYTDHRAFVNNWDLVDCSAHKVVGPQLQRQKRDVLYDLARSSTVWDRRIAMMATYHYIRQDEFRDALKIARILLSDDHDLIHKVTGWMLREIGKRDLPTLERFLKANRPKMARTTLRYAIEKLPAAKRQAYLDGKV